MQINLGTSLSGLRQVIAAGDSLPTQWSDFTNGFTVLPPSYVLVDADNGGDPHDYTAEGSENVITADDSLEVSTTTSVQAFDHYPILAGWSEANGADALPNGPNDFSRLDVSNRDDIGFSVGQTYGEISASNSFNVGSDKIIIRAKYSGDAPLNVRYFIHYNQTVADITDANLTLTTSYQDFEIPLTLSSGTVDSQTGFFIRIRMITNSGDTTTLHVDKLVYSE